MTKVKHKNKKEDKRRRTRQKRKNTLSGMNHDFRRR
jgi:hypothetical protein